MPNKYKLLTLITIIFSVFLFLGATSKTPKTLYRIYLNGKSIGLIESKSELENYIDKKQAEIKAKYHVNKVYLPDNLNIVKEVTYDNNISSISTIYNKIKDISPFTIKGYAVKIKGLTTTDSDGNKSTNATQTIYVLQKDVFTDAVTNMVKSFVTEEEYNAYAKDTQKAIAKNGTGKIIEKLYIQNDITIRKQNIPVDKTIYQDKDTLSKYLLFGTTRAQQQYTVKDGDTISDVAFSNKISTEEFLIANPTFKDENSLLYPGQQVTIGVLKPQFNIVEEDHVVSKEEKNYETITKYDNDQYVGYSATEQAGIKGLDRVTQKIQKINGQITNIVTVTTENITPAVNEVIVKGGKQSYYTGSGYGTAVATKGEWGWPATCSSISSPFGYRWGGFHDGTDIAGCGYGSNIFAAQSGTVVKVAYKYDNGNYIVINHNNGWYTLYAHLSAQYVKEGQSVAKGQVIGAMGQTGYATGVHLHFAIWYGYPYYGGKVYNAMSFY
jgi:murein DD-endopeptidase MepM/ murein hydrolase activator NlpD